MSGTDVRLLTDADAAAFSALRLEGLERCPQAFSMSAEVWRTLPLEAVKERIRTRLEGSFTLGGFSGETLCGVAGLRRLDGKERHKAQVWGVYVTESARGRGVGRALLEALIERAKTYPDLEQLTLSVATEQAAARGLYASLGFEVWGLERRALKLPDRYADEEYRVLWLREGSANYAPRRYVF